MVEPLRLQGVSKRYGTRSPWVLRGVDLEIAPGSVTRIEGANGSGKSTLLAIMAGISRPNRGRITGGGHRAYVPERLPAVLPYDVTGYLVRLGTAHGLSPDAIRHRTMFWLDQLDLTAWARAPMTALSLGTARKVALAQALMADADVLVLDEAWSGLDAKARAVLDQAVAERTKAGVAVVYVDHQRTGQTDLTADVHVVKGGDVVLIARAGIRSGTAAGPGTSHPTRTQPSTSREVVEIEFDVDGHRKFIQVPVTASDDTLRQILAQPRHHIRSVHTLTTG
jgi:ABC-type multidrug transport system ATPase subunit